MPTPIEQLVPPLLEARGRPNPAATRAAARLMTALEDDPARLPELYRAVAAAGGDPATLRPRVLIGVTGAPGSGKSTLTDALVAARRHRSPDRRVGVIAVDPSSPFTGGAVLGDRVRMMRHATDPYVFIRSLASRGRLGGLALGVKGVASVMALAGCDTVLIETVGVGQSEVEIARVADVTLVVLAPGGGDSVQLLKAGLMEAGDVFVVNKADREGAATLHAQLLASLQMVTHVRDAAAPRARADDAPPAGATPLDLANHACHDPHDEALLDLGMHARAGVEVHLVSAQDGTGVAELLDALEARAGRDADAWAARRDRAAREQVREAILEAAHHRLAAALGCNGRVTAAVEQVLAGRATVAQLTDELLRRTAREGQAHE